MSSWQWRCCLNASQLTWHWSWLEAADRATTRECLLGSRGQHLNGAISAGGRLVVLLEGGYSLRGLSESVTESFLGLLGDESLHPPDTEVVEPMDAVWQRVHEIRRLHGLEQGSH